MNMGLYQEAIEGNRGGSRKRQKNKLGEGGGSVEADLVKTAIEGDNLVEF